jgi:hypothetical protein
MFYVLLLCGTLERARTLSEVLSDAAQLSARQTPVEGRRFDFLFLPVPVPCTNQWSVMGEAILPPLYRAMSSVVPENFRCLCTYSRSLAKKVGRRRQMPATPHFF